MLEDPSQRGDRAMTSVCLIDGPVSYCRSFWTARAPERPCCDNLVPDHASVAIYLKSTTGFLSFASRSPALESPRVGIFFFLFLGLDEKVKFHTYYSTWHLTTPRGCIKANEMEPSALL